MNLLCDKEKSSYMIMYSRLLTSAYVKNNVAMFEAFIYDDINHFCRTEIEEFDCECDQVTFYSI